MKKFNKVISIEVSVDSIADRLLKEFSAESAHKEIIVEAIIGNLLNKNRLSGLFSALNGYKTEIDFTIGKIVQTTETAYDYRKNRKNNESMTIGVCKIIKIDEYADSPIQIEYQVINIANQVKTETQWTRIEKLSATELVFGVLLPHADEEPSIDLSKTVKAVA